MAVILYRYMEKDKAVYAKSNKFGFVPIEMRVYPNPFRTRQPSSPYKLGANDTAPTLWESRTTQNLFYFKAYLIIIVNLQGKNF